MFPYCAKNMTAINSIFSLSCTFDFLQMNTELLKDKAELLEEYFCIYIDSHGNLSRLPVILDQYTPDMDRIPEFVLSLGNDVGLRFLKLHFFDI